MGRGASTVRHRTAKYYSGSARSVESKNSFGVYSSGFSYTFSHNWNNWAKYAEATKKRMVTTLRNKMIQVSQLVADEARKRCPHYTGALEKAIAVSVPTIEGGITARGHMEMAVGVLSSWESDYDKVVDQLKEVQFYPEYSGPELASYLHEMYDTFIYKTKEGLERKRRKEAMTGRVVGSHFLSRAFTENSDKIQDIFTTWRGAVGSIYEDEDVPF